MSLPTDDKARKNLPIFRGPLMYFPDALLAVAAVCKAGNDQHNPGEPLHWARGKSMEQLDTALRHMMDHGMGTSLDTDGMYHMAKAAWRCLAELQLQIERDRATIETPRERLTGLDLGLLDLQMATCEPKVGDRVRITDCGPRGDEIDGGVFVERLGKMGTISAVDKDDLVLPYRVRIDGDPAFGEDTHGMWCAAVVRCS